MRDDIDLDYFTKRLEPRLKALTEGQTSVRPLELDPSRIGRLSRMDAMQQREMAQAAAHLAKQEIQRIRKAIDRMKSGDYGYCIRCEEEIAEGRLKVDPSALTCIACARAAEAQ